MIFPHRVIEGEEEAAVIADLMARIPTLNCAGTKERWERGWQENLDAFRKSGEVADLRPKYIRGNQPVRLNGKFVMPEDPDIEAKWYEWFFAQIIQRWTLDCDEIWEYGCGSGHNVATLARAYPNKRIVGGDWSKASGEIIIELNKRYRNAWPAYIDFFDPMPEYPRDAAVATALTVGALEQTGTRWQPFLDYLLAARPKRIVHIEPILDWYDPHNPVDATAIAAHKARGFWEGYLGALSNLHHEGKIMIEHTQRTGFGSLWIEGYSVICWRPI